MVLYFVLSFAMLCKCSCLARGCVHAMLDWKVFAGLLTVHVVVKKWQNGTCTTDFMFCVILSCMMDL